MINSQISVGKKAVLIVSIIQIEWALMFLITMANDYAKNACNFRVRMKMSTMKNCKSKSEIN